ncbi:MAG: radical SAM protein [Flammeovirgaceae bacterium]|nr:radical SAM protein [Flammeovirgaceae bacterium]MBR08244.1 radical SAM protein [Rickettsiales bacterium]HCX21348.1 radical SAM protein [Cytophagales bacterium]|tara:strand:+ start:1722 stop:2768 length:1047 start_codon:yes stop_codon:yes gene_type:complete
MKGKGAQYNPSNPFATNTLGIVHDEGIDQYVHEEKPSTEWFFESPKNVLSKNDSPDLKWDYSVNPYQGCEHGCTYCYARNSHTYWGFSAGLDFESKIIVKKNVAKRLEGQLLKPNWKVQPIMLSGNTDCYQPAERNFGLTRELLKVVLKYRNPVSVITKNALILRDKDILKDLASLGLVHVYLSITSLNEELRGLMEPRTSTSRNRLKAVSELSEVGVPVGVMMAPIIPGLNHSEIPDLLKAASEAGAVDAGFTVVRLNGQIAEIFEDWLRKTYPDRADKVMNQVRELHGGKPNDTNWQRRLKGEGQFASIIDQLFQKSRQKYFEDRKMPPYNMNLFRRGGSLSLFEI